MVGTFSPQSDSGGTLHFPSPTHIHHVDPSSAFRQLRRSLSRSPSKVSAFRLVTSKSTSPSPQSPLSPPRAQTPVRSLSENLLSPSTSTPNPSSTRRIRQPARKLSPLRHSSRPSSSHRSPKKRTLQESASSGNATPRSSAEPSEDQENRKGRSLSPVGDPMIDVTFKADLPVSQSSPFAPPRATARFEREYNSWSAKSSPLKRSDGRVNWDQGCGASPSAKRRSLHGGIFSPDFDIFDQAAASDSQADTQMTNTPCDTDRSLTKEYASPLPSRTSSLRKTTLQQRQEKPFSSRKQHTDSTLDPSSPAHPLSKARSRMSLESVLPSMPRDSPFSSQGSLLNASVHPMFQQAPKAHDPRLSSQPQRHPLSRTISQSTSASSMAEDSPTHIPVRQAEQRRPFVDFSKSLPVGTNRPPADESQTDSQTSNFSFATPENYKLVKPLPAAFMSTGLISKRHKHPEPAQPNFGASTSTMPDTPCKRHSLAEIPSPSASREAFAVKPHPVRHSFGNPSTPFHSQNSHATPASFGQGVGIFGSSVGKGRLQRSASFLDVESDEPLSPSRNTDSQSSAEFEVPPTPTRIFGSVHNGQPAPFRGSVRKPKNGEQVNGSLADSPPLNVSQQPTCKLSSPWEAMENVDEDSDDKMGDSPSVSLRFRHFFPLQRSFTHSRLLRQSKSPTPLNRASLTAPALLARRSLAKRSPLSPASPQENRSFRWSPRTPKDNMIPPDPSGLSISQLGDEHVQSLNKIASSASIFPPATPTASKDLFARSRASATPSHIPAPVEVDPVLTSRFDKVELIGTGEFSQVFRVSRKQDSKNVSGYFSMPLAHKSPKTPLPDRVWAVKKTRNQYIGPKDRQRKLREVEALKALGQAEHTVELIDSWEHHNRLYMQTEFCEEGSLDVFLERKGFKARLDDFRIWKILLELSFGLKHVHDRGFIHLDLKPANVLITYEGLLKIADFGMATSWPAERGIDGEGDREYIGPEILRGEFDKPADVYALGLIMLEIAGNVVLPDNGVSWQRLRSGDMSDVPSLTWSSENSKVARDSSGEPLSRDDTFEAFYDSDSGEDLNALGRRPRFRTPRPVAVHPQRSGELAHPPMFMVEQNNPESLDNLVRWMISPTAGDRPVVDQLLNTNALQWVERRRRAGATIFEGNWGPADEVLADDAEMIDV